MDIRKLHQIVFTVGRLTPQGVDLLGTCFLLNKPGLFATASHVANNDDNNLVIVLSQTTNLLDYQDTSNTRVQTISASIFKVDPVRDIAILKIDRSVAVDINISNTDTVSVGSNLAIAGFPHSDFGRQVLTYQTTVLGAKILIESSGIKSKHVVLNIQTKPGQSGSPIFNLATSQVVAMLIGSFAPTGAGGISLGGIDPQTLHQTTHAVSTEYIQKML